MGVCTTPNHSLAYKNLRVAASGLFTYISEEEELLTQIGARFTWLCESAHEDDLLKTDMDHQGSHDWVFTLKTLSIMRRGSRHWKQVID